MPSTRDLPSASPVRWIVPFAAAVFGMLTLQMSNLGFSPLLPDLQNQFYLSFSQIGLFTGMYGIVGMILSVPAGLLARRFGEGIVLVLSLIVVAVGLCSLAAAPGFPSALASRTLWLCGYRVAFVSVMVAVAVTAPPRLKGSMMGILGSISALASVIGAPFGGLIGAAFGWRRAFLAYGLMALLGALAVKLFYLRGHSRTGPISLAPRTPLLPKTRLGPTIWVMAATIGLVNMGGFTMTFFGPAILRGNFHAGPKAAAFLISASYLAAIAVNILAGLIADATDRLTTLIGISVLLIAAASMLSSPSQTVFTVSVIALISLGLAATNQSYALVGAIYERHETGPAMGIVSLGSGVYAYVGPQLFGFLRDRTGGFHACFSVLLVSACLSLLALIALRAFVQRRPRSPAAPGPLLASHPIPGAAE